MALWDIIKEISLEVNAEKTKYTFTICHKNAGQYNNVMIANKPLKI
jgi:hypothetical protein